MSFSNTATLVDNHVLENGDHLSPVDAQHEGKRGEPRSATYRFSERWPCGPPIARLSRGGARGKQELADGGVVVRRQVSWRTRSVAVVGLVSRRLDDPAVPADLAERDPQRASTASRLAVTRGADWVRRRGRGRQADR